MMKISDWSWKYVATRGDLVLIQNVWNDGMYWITEDDWFAKLRSLSALEPELNALEMNSGLYSYED